jgi:H+/Cl- antiporter ClcA
MVGAAAFTAGVTRSLSIVIIVFELTEQLTNTLPVLLSPLSPHCHATERAPRAR